MNSTNFRRWLGHSLNDCDNLLRQRQVASKRKHATPHSPPWARRRCGRAGVGSRGAGITVDEQQGADEAS